MDSGMILGKHVHEGAKGRINPHQLFNDTDGLGDHPSTEGRCGRPRAIASCYRGRWGEAREARPMLGLAHLPRTPPGRKAWCAGCPAGLGLASER